MKKIKSSRAASFLTIAAIYILAIAAGILVYSLLPFHFAIKLLIADIAATVLTFIFSLIFGNASVYDPYWSIQPPIILSAFALVRGTTLLGAYLLIAVWFWAARLTANWAYTFRGLNSQDWRYTMLSEKTGKLYPLVNFVGIHLVPTLVVYGCTLPAVYAMVYGYKATPASIIFCILAMMSASLQGVADIQMHKFKKNRTSAFIRTGLWKYSRHPNYLGEILQWWCIAMSVFFASYSWQMLLGALANTLLFLLVSIPMADGKQSKKEGWQDYKAQTRALLPIYKKQ